MLYGDHQGRISRLTATGFIHGLIIKQRWRPGEQACLEPCSDGLAARRHNWWWQITLRSKDDGPNTAEACVACGLLGLTGLSQTAWCTWHSGPSCASQLF